jgi:hypothetical protein
MRSQPVKPVSDFMHKERMRLTPIPCIKRHIKFNERPIGPSTYVVISPDAPTDSGTIINPPIHVALKRSSGYHIPLRRNCHFLTIISDMWPATGAPTVRVSSANQWIQGRVLTEASQSAGNEARSDDGLVRDVVPHTLLRHQRTIHNVITSLQ